MNRNKNIDKDSKEQGFILVIGTIIMSAFLLLVVPFLFQLSTDNRLNQKDCQSSAALSLAEAGVERAIWELNYGDILTWNGDSSLRTKIISDFQTAGGDVVGDMEIKVMNPEGTNPAIEATGKVVYSDSLESVNRTIIVALEEKAPPPLFDFGVFGGEGCVDLSSNSMIDSYDSRLGDYGGSNVDSNGHVGTNASYYGCIDLSSNAKIYGNAVAGPGSNPNTDIITRGSATIYGEKLSLPEEKELPSVPAPEGLPYMGDFYLDSNSSDIISASGEYSSFRLRSNSKVTITSDVTLYITGDFSLKSNSQIEIAEGVSVTIYLGGSFEQESNTQINNLSRDPTHLLIMGTDGLTGELAWRSNSQFWGAVYVPKVPVKFFSNADFCGSIIGRSFELSSNSRIHYDESLADLDVGIDGSSDLFSIKSWQEKRII